MYLLFEEQIVEPRRWTSNSQPLLFTFCPDLPEPAMLSREQNENLPFTEPNTWSLITSKWPGAVIVETVISELSHALSEYSVLVLRRLLCVDIKTSYSPRSITWLKGVLLNVNVSVIFFSPPAPRCILERTGGLCISSPQRWSLGLSKYSFHFLLSRDTSQRICFLFYTEDDETLYFIAEEDAEFHHLWVNNDVGKPHLLNVTWV